MYAATVNRRVASSSPAWRGMECRIHAHAQIQVGDYVLVKLSGG